MPNSINSKKQCSSAPSSTGNLKAITEAFKHVGNPNENLESIVEHLIEHIIHPLAESEVDSAICLDLIMRGCKEINLSKNITNRITAEFKTFRSKCSHGENSGFYSYNKSGESKINEGAVAEWISRLEDHYICTSDGQWWRYDSGVYSRVDKEEIKRRIITILDPELLNDRIVNSIMGIAASMTYIPYDRFNEDPNIVNCENGLLNIKTGVLLPHTPDYLSTVQFPVKYLEDTDSINCPAFNEFLDFAMSGDKEQSKLIYQMIGYLYAPHNFGKKAFVFYGPGNTGKTTLINIIRNYLIGEKNCASIALQDLEKNFAASNLIGKALNSFDDLPTRKIEDNGTFKTITGGGPICIDRKYKEMINVTLSTKFLFATNNLPANISGDRTEAFYDRLLFFIFDHIVSNAERDPHLLDKIAPERDSIFTLAMYSLRELAENRYIFSETEKNILVRKQYRVQNDSVEQFFEELFIPSPYTAYPCVTTYELYVAYCLTSNLKACSKPEFKKRFTALDGISEAQVGESRTRCFKGIYLSREKYEGYYPYPNWDKYDHNLASSRQISLDGFGGETL
ncbi:MAG: DUF5906 domain-containing protein [Saccharofermentans sp.]|nr:DUF5906 domain-containing protein [Saccharofermentans sp.]